MIPIKIKRMAVKVIVTITVAIAPPSILFHYPIIGESKSIFLQRKPTNIIYLILYFLPVFIPFGFLPK